MERPRAIWIVFLVLWGATQVHYGAVAPLAVAVTALLVVGLVSAAFLLLPGGLPLSRVSVAFIFAGGAVYAIQLLPIAFLFPCTAALRVTHGVGIGPGTADTFLTLRSFVQFSLYVLVSILVLKLRRDGLSSSAILEGIVVVLLLQAGYGLVQQLVGINAIPFFGPRIDLTAASGTFVNRNTFAGVLAMGAALAAALAYARFVTRRSFDAGIGWAFAASFLLVGLVASKSRGGAVGTIIGLLTLPLLHRGRGSLIAALVIFAIGAVGVMLADPSILLDRFSADEIREASRWEIWGSSVAAGLHQPVLGFGVGTFPQAYHPYQPIDLVGEVHHAHNEYVNAFFEGGGVWLAIVTAGLALWFVRTLHAEWRLFGEERILPAAVIAAVCAEAVHSLVDFDLRVTSAGMLFAVLIGLGGAIQRPKDAFMNRIPLIISLVTTIAAVVLLFLPLDADAKVDEAARSHPSRAATVATEALWLSPYNYRAAWILARVKDDPASFTIASDLWPAHPGLQKDVGLRLWINYAEKRDRWSLDCAARSLQRLFVQVPGEVGPVMRDLWWRDAKPSDVEMLLPEFPAAWGEFAGFLVAKGMWREGLDAFTRGCPEDPRNAPVFDAFSARLISEGQWGMAAAILDRRLKIKSDPAAHGAAARAWGRIKAWDRALREAEMARRTDPLNAEWMALTGDLLRGDHQLEKALEAYLEAVRLCPLDLELRLRRASLYKEMKLWMPAADDYREVLRARPSDRGALLGLVHCLLSSNNRERARSILEDFLRRYPGDGEAVQLLENLK